MTSSWAQRSSQTFALSVVQMTTDALSSMGREQAAIALAVVSTKDPAHFRTTAGGYFHCMVAKAKAGALNLDRTLWAMRRAAEPKPLSQPATGASGCALPGSVASDSHGGTKGGLA
jgi:Replication protein C C-terminal region